jgi:cell division protein FtsI (penicillin-binding protein 3)
VAFLTNSIPDVTGMSLSDAVYILEKVGIATEVKGYGRVKKQLPEANTPLKKNGKVVLELDIES